MHNGTLSLANSDVEVVDRIVDLLTHTERAKIVKTPAQQNLHFKDVTFHATDGTELKGWFILCPGSSKLIIANHPRNFNRHGCPSHEPFRSFGSWTHSDNGTEVDYLEDYSILHGRGYNVLTYDMRNFGESGSANAGLTLGSRHEAHDVLGSLRYARDDPALQRMSIGLFCRCNGAAAAFYAFHAAADLSPDALSLLQQVHCLLALQPVSARCVTQRRLDYEKKPYLTEAVNKELQGRYGLALDDMSPVPWARSVNKPVFLYGVKNDQMTFDEDLEAMFNNLGTSRKSFDRKAEGTSARWDGYREFSQQGAFTNKALEFFDKYVSHDMS